MIAIRATYDGKDFKPLPSEQLPEVKGEVEVTIVFLNGTTNEKPSSNAKAVAATQYAALPTEKSQREIAEAMLAARDKMQPLGFSIKELIEEGRER